MEYVSSTLHVLTAFFVFISGLYIAIFLGKKFQVKTVLALTLYLWHTLMCVVYMLYASNNPADANRYFNSALNLEYFALGTKAIELITNVLKLLNLSYLGCFLFFNIIGFIGLIAFAGTLIQLTKNSTLFLKWLAIIIIFLPSASFWSSAIGKDAFSFLATGVALWAALNLHQRKSLLVIAILSMLLVRPHMAGIMLIALSFSIIFDKNANVKLKAILAVISSISLAVLIPFILNYTGVGEDLSVDSVNGYFDKKQGNNQGGGSSLDISSMSLPLKMFTYLFRPLPHEAHNITALLASLDNIILLFLFILGGRYIQNSKLKKEQANRLFLWIYSIFSLLILSLTTANLGIAMRQKWMFLPIVIYLLMSAMVIAKKNTNSHHKNKTNLL